MKYGNKLMVVPFVNKLEKTSEKYLIDLDSEMTTIIHNKNLSIDDKVKMYNQTLQRFLVNYSEEDSTKPRAIIEPKIEVAAPVVKDERENSVLQTLQNYIAKVENERVPQPKVKKHKQNVYKRNVNFRKEAEQSYMEDSYINPLNKTMAPTPTLDTTMDIVDSAAFMTPAKARSPNPINTIQEEDEGTNNQYDYLARMRAAKEAKKATVAQKKVEKAAKSAATKQRNTTATTSTTTEALAMQAAQAKMVEDLLNNPQAQAAMMNRKNKYTPHKNVNQSANGLWLTKNFF